VFAKVSAWICLDETLIAIVMGSSHVRQHLAARRMRPAQQRFKPDHLAVANILLRLIDEV
jgi:hypothetical protein